MADTKLRGWADPTVATEGQTRVGIVRSVELGPLVASDVVSNTGVSFDVVSGGICSGFRVKYLGA